ncbi:hypothetical protein ABZ070_01535 [Streptomyces sp. NPDC006283]|uniref:hypothetical protein n=1 Tax=Streptomyces sp. NPDC006283 TaxID=3156741 RepID=UPI0033B34D65
MPADLSPLIAATTRWLTRAFPAAGGAFAAVLSEAQARQAVTVAAWLRYPTVVDAALVMMAGPGGSARLDWIAGAQVHEGAGVEDRAWRSWVDEVVASWAGCMLAAPATAREAVEVVAHCEHTAVGPVAFRRLTAPDDHDLSAAALLRHPELLEPIAGLHRAGLVDRLRPGPAPAR